MMVMTMIIWMRAGAEYVITSVADAWHVSFLEDGPDGDADDNSGDGRG